MKATVRSGLRYGVLRGLAIPLRFLQAIVLGRILGTEGFGTFGYALSWSNLIGGPYIRILQALTIRETARLRIRGRYRPLGVLITSARSMNSVAAGLLAAASILFILCPDIASDRQMVRLVGWTCAQLGFMIPFSLVNALLRADEKPTIGLILEEILRPLLVIGSVLILYETYEAQVTAVEGMMSLALATGLILFLATLAYRRMSGIHKELRRQPKRPNPTTGLGLRRAVPLAKFAMLNIAYTELAVQALGLLKGMEDVGIYRTAMQFSILVGFGGQCTIVVLQPHASRIQNGGDLGEFQRTLRFATRLGSAFSITLALVLVVFGREIVSSIFGSEYAGAYGPMLVLAFSQIIGTIFGPTAMLLNMNRMESTTFRHLSIACGISVASLVLLVPDYGMTGAAFAVAMSLTYWKVALWWRTRALLEIDSSAYGRMPGDKDRR